MPTYYVFQGPSGTVRAVTADRTGGNLPPHPIGAWRYVKQVDLHRGGKETLGPSDRQVIDAVELDGYYLIP